MINLHPLDTATKLSEIALDRLAGVSSDAYWNFAGPFGGYIAALFMHAIMRDERRLGPPVAQTVNYCGALAKGSFEIDVKLQRSGKATQHWSLELHQAGVVAATASIVCANRRETFAHTTTQPPDVSPPDQVARAPTPDRLPWLKAYDFRFIDGAPSFGAPRPEGDLGPSITRLWLKDAPDRPLDYVSLAALSDCFILRLVQMRGTLPPMSTVSMTTYIHAMPDEIAAQGTRHLLGIADAKRFHANFHDQSMELWGSTGKLLATGMQNVWYRE